LGDEPSSAGPFAECLRSTSRAQADDGINPLAWMSTAAAGAARLFRGSLPPGPPASKVP